MMQSAVEKKTVGQWEIDLIQFNGIKYHLDENNALIFISSSDFSPEFRVFIQLLTRHFHLAV